MNAEWAGPGSGSPPDPSPDARAPDAPPAVRVDWDAGDLGCGDLVLALKGRLRDVPPGTVFTVRATDPGAILDLPAWCHMTGHEYVAEDPPIFFIRRRED